MSIDNPYYFYNDKITQQRAQNNQSTKGGFSLFRRRSSSNSSTKSNSSSKTKIFNSATLASDASTLGSRRGSLRSLLKSPISLNQVMPPQTSATYAQGYNDNKHHTIDYDMQYRKRLGSYNESITFTPNENDEVFQPNLRNKQHHNQHQHHHHHHHLSTSSYTDSTINNGSVTTGIRRHSIGTFLNRTRHGSVTDEVPKTIAPKPPTIHQIINRTKYDRRNGDACTMDDILIITSRQGEPALLWAHYLKTRFDKITQQRGRQPFNFLHIKIDEEPITSDTAQRCKLTKLQIVILCPTLLSLPHDFLLSQLSLIINTEVVLGVLLEITEDDILEIHKNALPSFKKWRRCVVRNRDHSNVGNILGIATDILGRALCQRPLCNAAEQNAIAHKPVQNEAFTILPRKVKIGQNKVVALLNEPLLKDDWIKIKIEKTGEIINVLNFKKRNPYTLQFIIPESCMEVSTMIEIHIDKNEVELGSRPIKCESRLRELEHILKSQDSPLEFMCQSLGIPTSDKTSLDLYLNKSFQKNIPPNFHLLSGVNTKQNGITSYKDCATEEYPTLLHFAAKWGLEQLSLQIMECPGGDSACIMRNYLGKTPADLAEASGFLKLAENLRSFSQMNEFSTMYHYFKEFSDSTTNSSKIIIDKKSSDNNKISDEKLSIQSSVNSVNPLTCEEYMEMNGSDQDSSGNGNNKGDENNNNSNNKQKNMNIINAVTNLNYINIESDSISNKDDDLIPNLNNTKLNDEHEIMSNELKIHEPAYYDSTAATNKSDEFSQVCSNVLENCKLPTLNSSAESDYLIQPSNKPVFDVIKNGTNNNNNNNNNNMSDYITHPSNRPVDLKLNLINSPVINGDYLIQPSNRLVNATSDDEQQSHIKMNFKNKKDWTNDKTIKSGTLKRQGSDTSKTSITSVDDELAEIIYDFKNNVFTIQEVEQLVSSWKNRNDVQKSFKDKQEQLQQMRVEYEKIQNTMKDKMKRPTPFERVKKLFGRNKNNQINNNTDTDKNITDELKAFVTCATNGSRRPISSLSLQSVSSSSSSSGRMSTGSVGSGTSLGDSGTHSDQEDRRLYSTSTTTTCRIGLPGSLMDNYLVPPPPRPVSSIDEPDGYYTKIKHNNKYNKSSTSINSQLHSPISSTASTLSIPSPSSEHYILFPSNIPVHNSSIGSNNNNNNNNNNNINNSNNNNNNLSNIDHHHHHHHLNNNIVNHDYLNFPSLNTIDESKEFNSTEIVGGVTVQTIKVQKNDNKLCDGLPSKRFEKSDLCTSFKPTTTATTILSVAKDYHKHINNCTSSNKINNNDNEKFEVLSKNDINEIYKNINELDVKTQENLKILTKTIHECNISVSRQESSETNSSSNSDIGMDCVDSTTNVGGDGDNKNHDYMNV